MDIRGRCWFVEYCICSSDSVMRSGTTPGNFALKYSTSFPEASSCSKPERVRKSVAVKDLSRLGRAMNMASSCGQMCK